MLDALLGDEDLLEDAAGANGDGQAAAAALAPAHHAGVAAALGHEAAAAVPAVAPRRRSGCIRRVPCSDQRRANIKAGVNRRQAENVRAEQSKRPSFRDEIAQRVFGITGVDHADLNKRHCPDFIRRADDEYATLSVDNRCQHLSDVNRGVVSHTIAQASRLKHWLQPALLTLVTNVYDDADLWIQKPKDWVPRGRRGAAPLPQKKMDKSLRTRGRCVHMPVMNINETILSFQLPGSRAPIRSCELVLPAVAMPKANYGVMWETWSKWSSFPGDVAAGRCLDPNRVVEPAWRRVGSKVLALAKDSLGTNGLLEGRLAEQAIRSWPAQKSESEMGSDC